MRWFWEHGSSRLQWRTRITIGGNDALVIGGWKDWQDVPDFVEAATDEPVSFYPIDPKI